MTGWFLAELWILDGEKQCHCWTACFATAEACREDVLTHYRHSTVGRPRIYQVNDDGTKTFVEEIDMRTPEQIDHANTIY